MTRLHRCTIAALLVLALSWSSTNPLPSAAAGAGPGRPLPDNAAYQGLPFSQSWSDTGLITADDDWSAVLGVVGYRGDGLTGSTGTDPQTILADGTSTPVDVNANQTNPNTYSTGGVTEFDLADDVVALTGSGTADAPFLLIFLNTSGRMNVRVRYNLRDLDGSADDALQPVALHYRVGATGDFTNVPSAFVADATTGPSLATLVTPVDVTLPAEANDRAQVQVRIMTTNAVGNDEWVGVDDLLVSGTAIGETAPSVSDTVPPDGGTHVAPGANVQVTFSEPVNVAAGWYSINCGQSGSHPAATAGGPSVFTLDPDADFNPGEGCTVTIHAASVTDQDGDDPPDAMAADHIFGFTVADYAVCAAELFISEYIEGAGNDKAIEIVNPTYVAADLAGYSLRIYANGSTSPSTIGLAGTLAPGDVWLVCNSAASFAGLCDLTTGSLSFNGDDAVALAAGGANVDVIGRVGERPDPEWGSGTTSTADNTLRRKSRVRAGDADGGDPFDPAFEWDGYLSGTIDGLGAHSWDCDEHEPAVAGTQPANLAGDVAPDASITVRFDEPVAVSGAWFTLDCAGSGSHSAAVTGGPQSFILDPAADFVQCEQCTVRILQAGVGDLDGEDPPDTPAADYRFDFTTACGCTSIPQLQGFGAISPCRDRSPGVTGCVTGVAADGFYLQANPGDGADGTSDAIYVYMFNGWLNLQGLAAGYEATATGGTVEEFYGATELYHPSSVSRGGACTLPGPVDVWQIQSLGDADPTLYENTEFMRVRMDVDGQVQGPTRRYESRFAHDDPEIGFVPWPLYGSLPHSPRLFEDDYAGYGSLNFLSGACNKDLPDVDFGDRIQATGLVGIMGYHFDKWQLVVDELLTQSLSVTDDPDVADVEAPLAPTEFALCTFNVENLFDHIDDGDGDVGDWSPTTQAEYEAMVQKRAQTIAVDLQRCSVVAVQEMEGKDPVWDELEARIESAAGGAVDYEWDHYESMDGRDITVGVFYDAGRVSLLDSTQRQGCSALNYGVGYSSVQGTRTVPNPCAGGTYPLFSRPPYVGRFRAAAGPEFLILVNHLKSKAGSDACLIADCTDWREDQAGWLAILASDYTATIPNLAIAGDLNDRPGSSPIAVLDNATTADGQRLVNVLSAHVPLADRYTYIFSGESGILDYIYLSAAFDLYHVASSPMHINADFPEVPALASDNCAGGTCTFGGGPDDTTSRHASDHDPVFTRLSNDPTAVVLLRFEASAQGTGVLLTWETATEVDNLGFNLYRAASPDAAPRRLNETLIPGQAPGSPLGAVYTWLDAGLLPGETGYYWLDDVDVYGRATRHGPLGARAGYRLYLPLAGR